MFRFRRIYEGAFEDHLVALQLKDDHIFWLAFKECLLTVVKVRQI